jgi:Putative metal-binding motif
LSLVIVNSMKKYFLCLLLVCLLTGTQTFSQFSAGIGSGSAFEAASVTYEAYSGGSGDGYSLIGTPISFALFFGGNGDGFSIIEATINYPSYLGGTGDGFGEKDYAFNYASFFAGTDDGFSFTELIPFNLVINAGDGDGFAMATVSTNTDFLKAGTGDGHAMASMAYIYSVFSNAGDGDGFSLADNNLFTGGNGDGFSFVSYAPAAANFIAGSGDGHSSTNASASYSLFNSGDGDGYSDISTEVRFIELLSNIIGFYCAGSQVELSYYAPLSFNPGNVFQLQLSDPTGSFNAPTGIGSLQSITSGTVSGIIPRTSLGGNQFKARIIATQPGANSSPTDSIFTVVAVQTFYADNDVDTYGNINDTIRECIPFTGYIADSTDCNDANPSVHPFATEICSDDDDDCDGQIDESLDCSANLGLTVLIEGYYLGGGMMYAALQDTLHPLNCDTVEVSLASASPPYAIIQSVTNVIQTNGFGTFNFTGAIQGRSYFIVIRHRNSLETWSKQPLAFNLPFKTFNFSAP